MHKYVVMQKRVKKTQRIYENGSMKKIDKGEIICHELENKGDTSSWLNTDEEWKKNVSILQENSMLW